MRVGLADDGAWQAVNISCDLKHLRMTSNSETKVCLALISGMPAAGKTTLANLFCECIESIPFDLQVCDKKGRLRLVNIAYDKLIPVDLDFTQVS